MEMTRFEIVQYFYDHLQRDANGKYRIEIADDQCPVQVDDAPYVVRGISELPSEANGRRCIIVCLSDGTREVLNPETLRIGEGNVPYCRVKQGEHEARFTRQFEAQLRSARRWDVKGELEIRERPTLDEGALNLMLELSADDLFAMGRELHQLVHGTLPIRLPGLPAPT